MIKRGISAIAAVVAILAFAVPSTAGAAKATCSAGVSCPVGTSVTLTGTDFTLTTANIGSITCATLNLTTTITVNSGTTVEAKGTQKSPTTTGCKNGANFVDVTELVITKLFSNDTTTATTKKGTLSFTLRTDIGSFTCNFTGTNVPFTYDSGGDAINFSEAAGVTSDNCGTTKLDAKFRLEKSGTTAPVILD